MSNDTIIKLPEIVTIPADRFADFVQKEAALDRLLRYILDGLHAGDSYRNDNEPRIYFDPKEVCVPDMLRVLFPDDYDEREEELFTKWYNKRAEAKNAAEAE